MENFRPAHKGRDHAVEGILHSVPFLLKRKRNMNNGLGYSVNSIPVILIKVLRVDDVRKKGRM